MVTASPTREYTKKDTRNAKVLLTEKDTGIVMVMNRPAKMEVNNGLGGNQPITEIDEQGYDVIVANNFNERKPKVILTFGGGNLDITSLSLNQKTKISTVTLRYPGRQQVLRAEYNPSQDGKLGYRVKKNADTRASFLDSSTGETKLLIQQTWDGFNPAIPNSFAIGEHYARKFSSDLQSRNNWVGMLPSADYAARSLEEGQIGDLEIWGLCFYTNDKTKIVSVPRCFVNPEGAGIKEGDTTVNLDVSGLGRCQPWNIYDLDEEIFCDD